MKKTMLAVLVLGLVFAGASGCTKEELPAQKEAAKAVQVPVSSVQEAAKGLEDLPAVAGVTPAVQSSTQALVREGSAIADGVAASAQSSSQDLIREGSAIAGGVSSAVQSSTQVAVREEAAPAEKI